MSDIKKLKSINRDFNINFNEKFNTKNKENGYFIIYIILLICSLISSIGLLILLNLIGYDKTNIIHIIGITILATSHIFIFSISTTLLIYSYY